MYSFRNDYNLIIAPPSVHHNNATSFSRLQCSGIVYDNFNSEGSRSLIRNHIGGGRLMINFASYSFSASVHESHKCTPKQLGFAVFDLYAT